jgi:hypothetical protein
MSNPPHKQCAACEKESPRLQQCGRCYKCDYCSRECQRRDWARHKKECVPPETKVAIVTGARGVGLRMRIQGIPHHEEKSLARFIDFALQFWSPKCMTSHTVFNFYDIDRQGTGLCGNLEDAPLSRVLHYMKKYYYAERAWREAILAHDKAGAFITFFVFKWVTSKDMIANSSCLIKAGDEVFPL